MPAVHIAEEERGKREGREQRKMVKVIKDENNCYYFNVICIKPARLVFCDITSHFETSSVFTLCSGDVLKVG